MATYRGFNFDSVYDALKAVAESIEDANEDKEVGMVEAGKPDNISTHTGDVVLVGLGKINKIVVSNGGRSKTAQFPGFLLIYVDGENEESQRRAAYLWDRLYAAIEADRTLGIGGCKCKVVNENPGGFRQNDRNMGASETPDLCAGAVLILDIEKSRESITIT